ncbi:hypothetical protein K9M74_02885 [Candidatus Woesearchaeota archaeon]|nr:hypothetical protein [Candidatus Woesearchaeota archaeon]
MRAYDKVMRVIERVGMLISVKRVLFWDQRLMMPTGAEPIRSRENVALATAIHRHLISSNLGKNIAQAEQEDLTFEEQATIREIKTKHLRLRKVKQSLITKREQIHSKALQSWKEAYEHNDFSLFEKDLEAVFTIAKRYGKAINKENPYEALLQEYSEDLTFEEITNYIKPIKEKILELLTKQEVEKREVQIDTTIIQPKKRREFGKFLAQKMGVDLDKARIDWSTRSFSTAYGRISIAQSKWIDELQTILHEGGHSIYELNLPIEHYGTPLSETRSFAIDESQAHIWERHVGRTEGFWDYFLPIIKENYQIPYDKKTILNEINRINKSPVRLEADELTYIVHLIIRFELEQDIISGKLKVKHAPREWNKKVKQYLGITPQDDREGILQDIHWSKGSIGYFPNYIVGVMIASQLYAKAKEEIKNLEEQFAEGTFQEFTQWLAQNIHQHGKKYPTHKLIKKATGEEISPKKYIQYLEEKYS